MPWAEAPRSGVPTGPCPGKAAGPGTEETGDPGEPGNEAFERRRERPAELEGFSGDEFGPSRIASRRTSFPLLSTAASLFGALPRSPDAGLKERDGLCGPARPPPLPVSARSD